MSELDKLMDMGLKSVLKEGIVNGVFLNFLAWMSESSNALFSSCPGMFTATRTCSCVAALV